MKHGIFSIPGLLGTRVISTNPPRCENCRNDVAGTRCAKIELYGGQLCVAGK